jgi:hypothetical protein
MFIEEMNKARKLPKRLQLSRAFQAKKADESQNNTWTK